MGCTTICGPRLQPSGTDPPLKIKIMLQPHFKNKTNSPHCIETLPKIVGVTVASGWCTRTDKSPGVLSPAPARWSETVFMSHFASSWFEAPWHVHLWTFPSWAGTRKDLPISLKEVITIKVCHRLSKSRTGAVLSLLRAHHLKSLHFQLLKGKKKGM